MVFKGHCVAIIECLLFFELFPGLKVTVPPTADTHLKVL